MTDIVERLRHHARVGDGWTRPDAAEAADEIERLRAECQRLAGEVSRAHKDALAWMERAAAVNAEIEAARQQGRIEGATKLQAERDAARAEAARMEGARQAFAALQPLLAVAVQTMAAIHGNREAERACRPLIEAMEAAIAAKEPGRE